MGCCRSVLSRILDLKGYGDAARLLEKIAEDDETFEFRSKKIDVTALITDTLGLAPEDAEVVSGLVLSIFEGPRATWDFNTAQGILTRNATYADLAPEVQNKIKNLKSIWSTIRERVLQ